MHKIRWFSLSLALVLFGCAGAGRSCSSCSAQNFGADWIVVQMDMNGNPYRCWELPETSVSNEAQSDGIYWKEGAGNLVHLSGHYNRVQVERGDWDRGFAELGLTREVCRQVREGRYSIESRRYVLPEKWSQE